MKTLPTIAAVTIALALVLSPMVVTAAGTITITSPVNGNFSGSQTYAISGTISPAPTLSDNVGITVKNPSGQTVDVGNVPVSSGAFSYSTAVGGSSAWTSGTYTITATDSYGATGSALFQYSASAIGPSTTYNSTRAFQNILGNLSNIWTSLNTMSNTLNSLTAQDATEAADIAALKTSVAALGTSVSTISASLTTMQSSLTSIAAQVTTMNTAVSSLSTQVTAAQQAAAAAQTAANNANNAVASTQTYVLVVAVLAAITLVLELAILVRKIS